jgi:hypothetical protein
MYYEHRLFPPWSVSMKLITPPAKVEGTSEIDRQALASLADSLTLELERTTQNLREHLINLLVSGKRQILEDLERDDPDLLRILMTAALMTEAERTGLDGGRASYYLPIRLGPRPHELKMKIQKYRTCLEPS